MHGKIFDIDQLPENQRDFYARFLAYGLDAADAVARQYGRPPDRSRVEASFVEETTFNAHAWSYGGEHGFSLHAGVPSLLHFCFNHILRSPHIFPAVGDAEGESEHRGVFGNGIPLELAASKPIAECISELPGLSRPRDEHRAGLAVALTEFATIFCVFHEVGHIVGGHAASHSRRMRGVALTEFTAASSSFCSRRLLRRVWEREADIIATSMATSFVLTDGGLRAHYASVFGLEGGADAEDSSYYLLSALLFALKVLFLYLGQVGESLKTREFHPHPLIRATYVHAAIRLAAFHDLGLDREKVDENLDLMTDAADVVCEELGLSVPALHGKIKGEELARVVEAEITRLESAHARLQARYAEYSWMPPEVWRERS